MRFNLRLHVFTLGSVSLAGVFTDTAWRFSFSHRLLRRHYRLDRVVGPDPLAGARFSVSIGIAVSAHADFSQMFRDADAALYQGREDGKSRIGMFMPSNDDVILTEIEIGKESQRYAVPFG